MELWWKLFAAAGSERADAHIVFVRFDRNKCLTKVGHDDDLLKRRWNRGAGKYVGVAM